MSTDTEGHSRGMFRVFWGARRGDCFQERLPDQASQRGPLSGLLSISRGSGGTSSSWDCTCQRTEACHIQACRGNVVRVPGEAPRTPHTRAFPGDDWNKGPIRNRSSVPQGQYLDQPTKDKDPWSLAIGTQRGQPKGAWLHYGTPDHKVGPKEV